MYKNVLVIGPGVETRGGITSVIKAYKQSNVWKKWNCIWIETYIDQSSLHKILFFLKSLFKFIVALPHTKFIHIHFSGSTSAKRKNVYFKIAKFFGKPIILHFHAFSPDTTIFGPNKKIYSKMFNDANAIIALSNIWKIQITHVVKNPNKIKVIYNPCSPIFFPLNPEKQKTILFAGTLNQRKGYEDLIKAYSLISHRHNEWKLILAGNGEIEKAKSMARELHIEDNITFTGWVSGDEKNNLYNNASIFCLPSYAEGFPMAVLEAWSYGIPVITTPVGGLPDILIPNENAMVFEAGDINNLARNLELLISNKELREKLSNASFQLSQGPFNINTISNQINELYLQIFNK